MDIALYRRLLAGESLTFVLADRARWTLTGPDRVRYLNGQVTSDMTTLANGHVTRAAVCTAKGRMEGDAYVASHADAFYLDAALDLRESLGARLDKYLIADDAVFEDITDTWSLSHVFGAKPPPTPANGFTISNARFGLPGHDVWVLGTEAVVIDGTVPSEVLEIVRLDYGLPQWGTELTDHTLPPEAGPHMLEAISYTKGCYVGQETIARLKSVGHVNKVLVFLQSDSASFPAAGAKVVQGEKEIGTVTSSGFSPQREKGIALAYVQWTLATEGATFKADGLNLTATTPFHKGALPC